MKIDKRYKVAGKISETRNNIIYKVSDNQTDRILALKLLKTPAPELIAQFKKEYFILQTFSHPNIVEVYDFNSFKREKKDSYYFTMEYVDGVPFNLYFSKKNLTRFLPFFCDALNVLGFIHRKGYIHCDLKPGHILIERGEKIKLVDFGFAQLQKAIDRETMGGTLRYFAPEMLKGEKPDARTDIYSLGIIGYESLTGREAFGERETSKIIDAVLNKNLEPIKEKRTNVPVYINKVIMRMADKQRMSRFVSCESIVEAIRRRGKSRKKEEHVEKVLYSDFIGREKYIKKINSLVDRVFRGQGQVLLIEGEAGAGKTRLLKELEHRLFVDSQEVQYYRITERAKFNFHWLIELLEREGANLSKLKKKIEKGKIVLSDKSKYRFFDKLTLEMSKISEIKKPVFLLDNMDVDDKKTTDFLLYLSSFLEKTPFLFIVATESIPHNLDKIIKDKIYNNFSKVKLEGFNKNETQLFVKNMLNASGNIEKLSGYLYDNTAGNPYFIEELLREIVERKLLKRERNNLAYNFAEVRKVSVPESVDLFVKERIGKLSEDEEEILKLLSVLGDSIPYSWLVRMSSYPESEIIRKLEGPSLKQFLSFSEKDTLDFTHKILKTIIYDGLGEEEKILYHNEVLKFLESLKESSYILKLKSLHSFIIESPKSVSYLHKLLRKSIKHTDIESAIDTFEKLQKLGKADVLFRNEKDTLLKIGNFYYHSGKFDKSISLYNELLKKVKKKSKRIKALHYLAMTELVVSQYDEAEEIFNTLLKEKLSVDQRFEILTDLGWFYYSKKDYKKSEEIYKKTLGVSKKGLKNRILLGKLFYYISMLKRRTNELEKAQLYSKKTYNIGKKYENNFYIIAGLNMLALLEQMKRRYDKAIVYYKQANKVLQKTEDLPRRLYLLTNLARVLFLSGNINESKKYYFKALFEAKKMGDISNISSLYNLYGRMLLKNAEWKDALSFLEVSNNLAESHNDYIIQLNSLIEMAYIYAFQGKNDEFMGLLGKIHSLAEHIDDVGEPLQIGLIQGIQKYINGDYKNALVYLNKIEDSLRTLNVPEYQIPALIYRTLCMVEIGKPQQASEAINSAQKLMKESKMFLYKEEIKFAGLCVKGQFSPPSKLRNQFKRLLHKTKNNQRFLYARASLAFSDIVLKSFQNRKKGKYLSESISILTEAKEIFNNIDAQPLIFETNDRLVESYEKLFESKTSVSKYRDYYDLVNELGEILKHIDEPEKLKKSLISMAKTVTRAERGLFLTLDRDTNELIVCGKDIDNETIYDAKQFSKRVIKRVTRTKKPLIVNDAIHEENLKNFESVQLNRIRSILCIPIIKQEEVFGTLYLDSRNTAGLFLEKDQKFFTVLSTLLADSLYIALDYKKMRYEIGRLEKRLRTRFGPLNLIGRSEKMQEVFKKTEKLAESDVPVLVLGESGTGKEMLARTIHLLSPRKENKLLIVDCSGVSDSLIESELFGHKKGAFTGAGKDKIGHFEKADKGTLFIDEIANASGILQSRLLRFLDTREVKRIGETEFKKVDTRIIIASNKNLSQLVKKGTFRQDLFNRLSKFIIQLPPLRERKEDIELLIDYYIKVYNREYNKNIKDVTKEVRKLFYGYDWKGNVRELVNEISRCVFFCNKKYISKEDISPEISKLEPSFLPLKEMKQRIKNEYIMRILNYTKGNVAKTARILRIDKATVYRNIADDFRDEF
jgi:transcriptional regulator with GAF, ATPase, and Fis domain/tRNA A-37 threonylcarbamoyl transferase component Bud32